MHVEIRDATTDDIPSMFTISCRCHRDKRYKDFIPAPRYQQFLKHYTEDQRNFQRFSAKLHRQIARPAISAYVVTHDNTVKGYGIVERHKRYAEFKALFIDPDYQSYGYGRRLFAKKMENRKQLPVRLKVIRDNGAAIHLYESFGFRKTRQSRKRFYGATQVCMRYED